MIALRRQVRSFEEIVAQELVGGPDGSPLLAAEERALELKRARLREIGRWGVPYLRKAATKRNQGTRIAMNAIMTLPRIGDPDCLADLRMLAFDPRHPKQAKPDVRATACLALGLFDEELEESAAVMAKLTTTRKGKGYRPELRGAALGLAKLDNALATESLLARVRSELPGDEFFAAACVLAASVRSPRAEPERFLGDREEIVRRAAAASLIIRPLPVSDARVILDILKKRSKDRNVRRLLWLALAAIEPRTDEINAALLRRATRTATGNERYEQIAALIAISHGPRKTGNYKELHNRLLAKKNDAVVAAAYFALVQTGDPKAVDDLLKAVKGGSKQRAFYAAGSLLYLVTLATPGRHPREQEIFATISRFRGDSDSSLRQLDTLGLRSADRTEQAIRFREFFYGVRDPHRLHLWDWSERDRAWIEVNRMIPALFELDDIADKGDPFDSSKTGDDQYDPTKDPNARKKGEGPGAPAGGGKAAKGSPEEQDLIDFLREKPYFGPEDLGGR